MSMDWREVWRLRLSQGVGVPASDDRPPAAEVPAASVDRADPAPTAGEPVRTRFFFVVARTRLDLFLTIRRQFRDDRTVYVMLDRREQDRRSKAGPVDFPDRRRQPDRRRPRDYWEDTAQHPAVLIPVDGSRQDGGNGAPLMSPEGLKQHTDKEPTMETMEHVLVDEARVRAWVQEGQAVLQHVLPAVLGEREALRNQLHEVTRRCRELQEENDGLRAEIARSAVGHRQLEQGHAEIVDSVSQFLTQLTQVLDPMRGLAEKLSQARQRRDGG
jgi:hypothetical protein